MNEEGAEINPHELASVSRENFIKSFQDITREQRPELVEKLDENSVVLSIGFGAGLEFRVLRETYPSRLIGIDVSKNAVDIAKTTNRDIENLTLICGDAGMDNTYQPEEDEIKADVIVLRSPSLVYETSGSEGSIWDRVIGASSQHLNKEGVFYITLNGEREVEQIKEIAQRRGLKATTVDNPNPQPEPLFSEKYIVLLSFTKTE